MEIFVMGLVLTVVVVGFVIAIVIAKQNDTAKKKLESLKNPVKPSPKPPTGIVKPQAPTKEELLLPMSDSELLRKIAKHSEESAFVLKRFLSFVQVIAVIWFVVMIIQFIKAAN